MMKAAKQGGQVIVLDYNLDETRWEPEPPVSFLRFYQAFLDWRSVNHWDNRTASNLTWRCFTQKASSMWRVIRVMSLFDVAIPTFWIPTHLRFGST